MLIVRSQDGDLAVVGDTLLGELCYGQHGVTPASLKEFASGLASSTRLLHDELMVVGRIWEAHRRMVGASGGQKPDWLRVSPNKDLCCPGIITFDRFGKRWT